MGKRRLKRRAPPKRRKAGKPRGRKSVKPRAPRKPRAPSPKPSRKPQAPGPKPPPSLRVLRALRKRAPTVGALAKRLRVHRSTIYRWLAEGLPRKARKRKKVVKKKIERVRRVSAAEKKKSEEELATFRRLMKLAGEAGVMPVVRSGDRTRSGRRTQGHQWTRSIKRELSPEVILEMLAFLRSIEARYPLWQIAAVTSQFAVMPSADFGGKHGKPDYKTVVLQLKHKKAGDFAVERVEPSREGSRAEVLEDFKSRMETILERKVVRVFVHGVTVFNYLRRTKKEEGEWATRERQKRHFVYKKRIRLQARGRRKKGTRWPTKKRKKR